MARVFFVKSRFIGRLMGVGVAACAIPAMAQQQPPAQGTPAPTPAPRPTIITTPGLDNFDLRGPRQQTPAPSPAPAPPPAPAPTITPPTIPAATTRPTPRPTPAATRPAPAPTPRATPTAAAPSPTPLPPVVATPVPAPMASATPAPVQPARSEYPWWVAALAGGATVGVLGLAAWFFTRRRPTRRPVARPAMPPAAAPPQPGPPAKLTPPPIPQPVAGSDGPIAFELRPLAIDVSRDGVTFEYELLVGNVSDAAIEGLRISLAMISANPDQDMWVEAFHAQPPQPPVAGPLELPARQGGRIAGKTILTHDRIHVVEVAGRPMFVPLVLIDARYRGGLSIRQGGADYMVGTEGEGLKLGPIWLDRGAQRHTKLAANRYVRKSAVQAAE
jgi:hypothetical protein